MSFLKKLVVPILIGVICAGLVAFRQSSRPGSELVTAANTTLSAAQVDLADRERLPDLPELPRSWSDMQVFAKFCGIQITVEPGDRPGPDNTPLFNKGLATAWYGSMVGNALDVLTCAQLANARLPIAFNSIKVDTGDETRAALTFTIFGRI